RNALLPSRASCHADWRRAEKMATEQGQPHDDGVVPRCLAGLAAISCRRPWLFVTGVTLSCLVCLLYTWSNLTYQTQRNDLHGQDREYFKRWQKYVAEFGDDDDMVVVVKGQNKQRLMR